MSSKKHYVKNADLYAAMVEYRKLVIQSKETGEQKPRVPFYVGECIMKIATHLAFNHLTASASALLPLRLAAVLILLVGP